MPLSLVFVTQVIDDTDSVLGFVPQWIRSLADRFDGIAVVANEVRKPSLDLGRNVEIFSLGKELRRHRIQRGVTYESILRKVFRERRPSVLLAHMCPIYLTLAAPLARMEGVKLFMWYAHPAATGSLALAERLSDRILTSLPGAYPRRTAKCTAIGQAIDMAAFPLRKPHIRSGPLRLVSLGRTAQSKGLETAIRAMAIVRNRVDAHLELIGPSTTPVEVAHKTELESMIKNAGLVDTVTLRPGVAADQVPRILEDADALINTHRAGSADKVVFEAMASGRIVLCSNPVFGELLSDLPLQMRFPEGDADALARRIGDLAVTDWHVRADLGRTLRQRVQDNHSLEHWAEAVFREAQR